MPLPAELDAADYVALNICRTGREWQASLEVERGKFRIRIGATPSEAIAALFAPAPRFVPPLPY